MRSLRILAAALGGYAFTSGYVASASTLLFVFGVTRGEAAILAVMTAFLMWLVVALWALGSSHPVRTAGLIVLASIVMLCAPPQLLQCLDGKATCAVST